MALAIMNASCSGNPGGTDDDASWTRERQDMVVLLKRYQIRDERILAAMAKVRRHVFIPEPFRNRHEAYGDHPCPIGYGQTISQPFIVAYMTEKLALKAGDRVLEIGTGSGYQAAVLAEMGLHVYSVEIVPELARHAREALAGEGYSDRVQVLTGDGYKGWPEYGPYDAIIVTCAPTEVPEALVTQLKEGGRFILPIGEWMSQRLVILKKLRDKVDVTDDLPVRFVPMVKGK
jgi:protein-L-isoaspartate(D-aspartate) O-methyltransferase